MPSISRVYLCNLQPKLIAGGLLPLALLHCVMYTQQNDLSRLTDLVPSNMQVQDAHRNVVAMTR